MTLHRGDLPLIMMPEDPHSLQERYGDVTGGYKP